MKTLFASIASAAAVLTLLVNPTLANEVATVASESATNTLCPISGKPIDPSIKTVYEGRTWSFAQEADKTKWLAEREKSLYQRLGGKAAIDAAVDAFYVKVLADERVKHFFGDINMASQHRKQKAFLSAALGGPLPWVGKDMRKAHEDLDIKEEFLMPSPRISSPR